MRVWGNFTAKPICTPNGCTKSLLATSYGGLFFSTSLLGRFDVELYYLKNGDDVMSEENKSQRITLRVSPKEKEELEKRAEQAKMSLSQYLIRAGENKKITVAENIPELFLEITRIGVNINQIAHVANSQKYVNTQQIYELKRLLREVQGDMEKIIKALGNNEEVTNDNLKEILLMVEKRMSGMERRISKFEMNFDQASYHVDERLDKIYKKIENGDTDE